MKQILYLETIFRCAFLLAAVLSASLLHAGDLYKNDRARWIGYVKELTPDLKHKLVRPIAIVGAVKDPSAFQSWRFEKIGLPEDICNTDFQKLQSVVLDFGKHYTGFFSFSTKIIKGVMHSPIRLKFHFAELPAELNTPLDPWKGGLARSWMQDEIITVTEPNIIMTIPRRMSFRYVKIEVVGECMWFEYALDNIQVNAQTSAGEIKTSLGKDCPKIISYIRNVGIETLKECMQEVYEDGPKRDRRLWLGDMYLENLANRHSFKNFALTKRCLYLFASTAEKDGFVNPCCFELPVPHSQQSRCVPYSLLFISVLYDYLADTQDYRTANDLWRVAKRQMELVLESVGPDGVYEAPKNAWIFFDWRKDFDYNTSMQALCAISLDKIAELAKKLDRESEIEGWNGIAEKMRAAAKEKLYSPERRVFISGKNKQISVLSQAWATLAGFADDETCRIAIAEALESGDSVKVGTPYAMHYVIEAMIKCGMKAEARRLLESYWGGMVRKGADTFWEVYDPNDDYISPYGFFPLNSACHAWSCTPVYFIHAYPDIFQK